MGSVTGIYTMLIRGGGLAAFLLSGCSAISTVPVEEVVGRRAIEQARAFMELDYDKALTYMTPTYQKSPSAENFRAEFSGVGWWTDVTLQWVRCEESSDPSRCEVRYIVTVLRPPATTAPIPVPLETVWVKLGGQWYRASGG